MQQILHARSEEKVRKQNESIRDEMMLDLQQRIADIDENHRKKDTPSVGTTAIGQGEKISSWAEVARRGTRKNLASNRVGSEPVSFQTVPST